jgi:hypothetical protein
MSTTHHGAECGIGAWAVMCPFLRNGWSADFLRILTNECRQTSNKWFSTPHYTHMATKTSIDSQEHVAYDGRLRSDFGQ